MDAQKPPIIQITDLAFAYQPHQPVLKSLTAALQPGRVTGLIGPNATGKSTLMKLLLGQLAPDTGQILLGGSPINELPPARRAAMMSYVPQRGLVSFAYTVEQVVSMGRHALPRDEHAINEAIKRTDLNSLRHRVYSELSVGQQQRVVLARAIAQSAGQGQVMLLDEPVSAMDLWHIHQTMGTLRELAADGLAILIVLHDLNLTAAYADDVWLLHEGELAACGPWDEVLQSQRLEPIYRVRLVPLQADAGQRPVFRVDVSDTMSV